MTPEEAEEFERIKERLDWHFTWHDAVFFASIAALLGIMIAILS